jgi:hypothetical protein
MGMISQMPSKAHRTTILPVDAAAMVALLDWIVE